MLQSVLLLFQIILGHENSEPDLVTQLQVQFTQALSAFQARVKLRIGLETVLHTSQCPVLVTTSGYPVTAIRCHVHV